MDDRVLEKLEFIKIRTLLAEEATYTGGKDLALSCTPTVSFEVAERWQQETAEALRVLELAGAAPFGGVREVRPTVRRAAAGGLLLTGALLDIATTLQAAAKLKSYLQKHAPAVGAEILLDLAGLLGDFRSIVAEITRCIDEEGFVVDHASPQLARIRQRLRRERSRVRERLEALVRSPKGQKALQEPIITIRAGRFVVPVRQEYRAEVPGIVHDQSASGATLFVEPMVAVESNNVIREAEAEEEHEVEKVLTELTGRVAAQADELVHALARLADLDFIFAKARLAAKWRGVRPQLSREKRLKIVAGRHPLLTGEVVPIDVQLGGDVTALVITGPNTGGKTVTLKSIGLFVLMAQAGLHVPADEGTCLPVTRAVFADIGDEQSIEQNLSTFSSHMSHIVRIVDRVGDGDLVLLDELGAGTDPTEGSALAIALLEYLIERGALVVATTHYSALKRFAYTYPGAGNASVEFDVESLRPTYRLSMGVAGQSNAFAIAQRLGLRESVIKRARQELSEGEQMVEEVLARVQSQLREAEKDREEARRLKERYLRLSEEFQAASEALKANRERIMAEARAESAALVAKAKRESEELLGRLRKAGSRSLEAEASEVRAEFERLGAELEAPAAEEREPGPGERLVDPAPGMRVYVPQLGQEGEIIELLGDGKALVRVGALRLTLPASDLARPSGGGVAARPPRGGATAEGRGRSALGALSLAKASSMSRELHLRGQLVADALEELDKYLDDAVLAGLERVRIVHGKGTGRMRSAVRAFLERDPRVRAYRFAEQSAGGLGVTEVDL